MRRITFVLLSLCAFAFIGAKEPSALYLTWLRDPATTMTIQWHTQLREQPQPIFYREKGSAEWRYKRGASHPLTNSTLLVHAAEITGLRPYTEYIFRIGQTGQDYLFRTMPDTSATPIKFGIGGDMYLSLYLFRKMNAEVARNDPDFVVIGGDLAYTQNHKTFFKGPGWEVKRWQTFFEEWKKQMISPSGRLIPMIVVLGNHDIKTTSDNPHRKGALFYELFALPKPKTPFYALDFGNYLSLFILDTGHDFPVGGQQTAWLDKALSERQDVPYRFAAYHIAAYPSAYSFDKGTPVKIRKYWVPLFEEYGIQAAFEHHNHTLKRTFKIKNGVVDETGILYLGDGSWGVPPRRPRKAWYLDKTAQTNAFWLATLTADCCTLKALDIKGQLVDETEVTPSLSLPLEN